MIIHFLMRELHASYIHDLLIQLSAHSYNTYREGDERKKKRHLDENRTLIKTVYTTVYWIEKSMLSNSL